MAATNINYHIDQQPTHSTVTLLPGMNNAQWSDIEQAGTDIMSRLTGMRSPAVMVDLTPLNYMGSSMVAMIVRCWKSIQTNNGRLVVVCDNDVVKEVISLAGLTKVWPIVATHGEGMSELGISGSSAAGASGGGGWLVITGILAAVAGLIGAGLLFGEVTSTSVAYPLLFGGAGVAFVAGLITLVQSTTSSRFWGLGIVLASAAIGIAGFMAVVQRSASPAAEVVEPASEPPATDATGDPGGAGGAAGSDQGNGGTQPAPADPDAIPPDAL